MRLAGITYWAPSEAPADEPLEEAVRWIDVELLVPELSEGDADRAAERLLEILGPHCGGAIDSDMVEDLLDIADKREGQTHVGAIRSLSSFRVEARRTEGELVFHPVEILAGEGWIVTCWHTQRVWRGKAFTDQLASPEPRDELLEALSERWLSRTGRSAGDLGVMLVHELALTYKPACFVMRGWLERWELELYLSGQLDRPALDVMRERLENQWGSMAQLREWIQPLNRPGLTGEPKRAWFTGVTNDELVIHADDKGIDPALSNLRELADNLRDSFSVLHVQILEEQRDRRERLQRRLEIAAAAFLIPTLVVGFYGANTHIPGQGTWWGFWTMVVALLILSGASVYAIWRWHKRDEEERAAARQRFRLRIRSPISRE